MSELVINAPLTGKIVALADVPDVVFSRGIVGPGLAIDPEVKEEDCIAHSNSSGQIRSVFAPIAGKIVKVFPHAAMIMQGDSTVLVHLGIDTVKMGGEGFELLTSEGSEIENQGPLVKWDLCKAKEAGHSLLSPVVILDDSAPDLEMLVSVGATVQAGDPIFKVR